MIQGYTNTATDKGARQYQEDRYVVIRHDIQNEKGWLLAVMDGHGGPEVAEFCKQNIETLFKSLISRSEYIRPLLIQLVKILVKESGNISAGSTISLVYISETKAWAHVATLGDSPVIVRGEVGIWTSPEHNIRTNEKDRELVLKNGAVYHDGYMFDPSGRWGLQLTRALGDFNFDRYLIRDPEIFSVKLNEDSFILVASDGLVDPGHKNKDIANLVKIIEDNGTAQDLVNDALRRKTRDNVTAVLWKQSKL